MCVDICGGREVRGERFQFLGGVSGGGGCG